MTCTSSTSKYDFQPSCNLEAIRLNIIKQVQKKRKQQLYLSKPVSNNNNTLMNNNDNIPTINTLMNHGLPSPPVEYQKQKINNNTQEEQDDDAVSTISSLPPTSSTTSSLNNHHDLIVQDACIHSSLKNNHLSVEQIEQKIKQLKQEKHHLFSKMKDLIKKEEKPCQKNTTSITTKLIPLKLSLPSPSPSPSPSPTTTPKISQYNHKPFPILTSLSPSSSTLSSPTLSSPKSTYHSYYHHPSHRPISSSSSTSSTSSTSSNSSHSYPSSSHPTSPILSHPPSKYYRNNHHTDRYRYNPYHHHHHHHQRSLSHMPPPIGYKIRRTSSHFIPRKPMGNSRPSHFRSRQMMDRHIPRY